MSFGARAHAPTRARAHAHTPTRTRGRARLPSDRLWLRNRQLEGIYFRTFVRHYSWLIFRLKMYEKGSIYRPSEPDVS